MANTTPTAIKLALAKLIIGTTPRGAPGARHRYKLFSDHFEFETGSVSDADLGFRIEGMGAGETMSFGTTAAAECQDSFVLLIGHARQRDTDDLDDRIAEDTQQLIQELIKPANLPASVWRIWPTGTSTTDHEKWIETQLTFDITYSIAQV